MRHALFASAFLLIAAPAWAERVETEKVALDATVIARGLQNPWGLDFLPDGAAVVTERPGRIRSFDEG